MATVYLAQWWHTWGEYSGIAGVFSTRELAEEALKAQAPKCYEAQHTKTGYSGTAGVDITPIEIDVRLEHESE